ncbi:hypothetical protein [Paenibacillus gorillae]|uniref:hypothetical protein n=1 Tax=Paenibacillus gorillae TaxID=1243662 RepID=UPI000693457E|nr:hypothetical protein [Paenibacillus gorillae]
MIDARWVIGLVAVIFILWFLYDERRFNKHRADLAAQRNESRVAWMDDYESWKEERKQLLDRIQAPSFGELKHAEVKVIKAQQGVQEPTPLEPL